MICQNKKAGRDITEILVDNLATRLQRFENDDLLSIELSKRLLRKGKITRRLN